MKGFLINRVMDFLTHHIKLDRLLRYRNPRQYWTKRGGDRYYAEQEGKAARNIRSRFIAQRLQQLPYRSVLEIGCGYGKQLRNLRRGKDCVVVGIDWSEPQLKKAIEVGNAEGAFLLEADAAKLPFRDRVFDLVLTSAVIMHNSEPQARAILYEMLRVGKRFIAHNEGTNISFNRYGYDMAETHKAMKQHILEAGPIPVETSVTGTQFTIAEIDRNGFVPSSPEDVPIRYHA